MFISERNGDHLYVSKALEINTHGVFLLGRVKSKTLRSELTIPSPEGPVTVAAEMVQDRRTLLGFGVHYRFLTCTPPEKREQLARALGNLK